MTKPPEMPTKESPRGASYQDVLDAPEHVVAEVVDGVLYTSPRPAPLHTYAHSELGVTLRSLFGRGGNGGAGGWLILYEPELHLQEDILVPDVAGWRRERMPAPPQTAYFTLAPDWACEVLSPSTRRLDQSGKRDVYAREGVAHLWFVDPEAQTLEVFELRDGHWTLLQTASGETEVAPPPFTAASFNLGDLWWSATSKFPTAGGIQESPAAAPPPP